MACPCGVDADTWKPSGGDFDKQVALVYWKSGGEAFCEQVEQVARACGLEPRRLRSMPGEHAIFSPADYRQLLDRSAIAIFLSTFETQGLALAEAWSMDVPTLVWDPQGVAEWRGRRFQSQSSAPYLTPATGRRWSGIDELGAGAQRGDGESIVIPAACLGAGEHDRRDLFNGASRDYPRGRRASRHRAGDIVMRRVAYGP